MSIIGLVPARGGSTRLPGKNIAPCAGKPLLAWTAEAALSARSIDRVLLSTDDEKIAAAGQSLGLEVPFLRPTHLSGPEVPMIRVMQHALDWLEKDQGVEVDALVLLQPTSPLRTARHIDEAVALLQTTSAASVVSITRVPHMYRPAVLHRIRADAIVEPYVDMGVSVNAAEPAYARNGPAVLVNRPIVLRGGEQFGTPMAGYVMSAEDSIDIDERFDLELAEFLLAKRDKS